jgi:hypothetical protein
MGNLKFERVLYWFIGIALSIALICIVRIAYAQTRDTSEQINSPPPFYPHKPNGGSNIMPIDYDYAVKRSFETSADNVYGVLVGLLVVGIISMGITNYRTNAKFIEVVRSNTSVMQGLLAKIDSNDEKVLNSLQKLLEGHRQEMQTMTTNLFTTLISQFMANMNQPRDKL